MKSFPVKGIPCSGYFSKPAYLDPDFVVAAPETPFSVELAKALVKWGFTEVYSDGEPGEQYREETAPHNIINTVLEENDQEKAAEDTHFYNARHFYHSFTQYVKSLFAAIEAGNEISYSSIVEIIKNVCAAVREGRHFLVRAQQDERRDDNYLVSHTVYSTVIAVIIGTYLKLPNHRLMELGAAALLHEVGMLKLSSQSYLNNKILSGEEKKHIHSHPILGYQFLKSLNFPLVICQAALEHQERENGSGYPHALAGNKISLYAKIIAVACSYEALSTKRPYKEAKDGHTGIIELLRNEGKQYDEAVVRALVYSLSIYPIGLYVLLSNGKKGQVMDIDPVNPRCPIVQIFGELLPSGKNNIMQISNAAGGISIIRPLTRDEIEG